MAQITICDVCERKLAYNERIKEHTTIIIRPHAPEITLERDFCSSCYDELVEIINNFYKSKESKESKEKKENKQ
jgi:hypothetical protein